MNEKRKAAITHVLFDVSVIAKGVDGILEIGGGILLLMTSPGRVLSVVRVLTQHELSEDPRDVIARYLLNSAHHLTAGTKTFAAAYLLWHGAVKGGLVAGLLLRKRWAYPAAIAAFVLFVLYQLYRYSHTHAFGLIALSALDIVVIVLTWLEYRRLRTTGGFSGKDEG